MFAVLALISFIVAFIFHIAHFKWVLDAELLGLVFLAAWAVFNGGVTAVWPWKRA